MKLFCFSFIFASLLHAMCKYVHKAKDTERINETKARIKPNDRRKRRRKNRASDLAIAHRPPIECGPSQIKMVFIFLVWTIFRILINRICRLNVSIVIWKAIRSCFLFLFLCHQLSAIHSDAVHFHLIRLMVGIFNVPHYKLFWVKYERKKKEMHPWKCTDRNEKVIANESHLTHSYLKYI